MAGKQTSAVRNGASASGGESPKHKSLVEALLAAQREMPAVDRDGVNPHFKSKFTTLSHLLSKTRPVLNKHGIVLVQAPAMAEGKFVLRTILKHDSGDDLTFDAPLMPAKNDPQGQGSAITYMRRYSLAAALAIADQEDDDRNEATRPQSQTSNGSNQSNAKIGSEIAAQLVDRAAEIPAARQNLRLAVSHMLGKDIGALEDRGQAVAALAESLSFEQGERTSRWIEKKKAEEDAEVANGGNSDE